MRLERALLLATGLALTAGCYSYTPVRVESLSPGQDVRVRLTPEEADRLVELRRTDNRLMEGTLLESPGSQLVVNTQVSRNDPMAGMRALIQTIDVPLSQVVEVESRELDRLKTGGLLAALAAGIVWVIVESTGDAQVDSRPPPGTTPPESRLPAFPLIRLPVGF